MIYIILAMLLYAVSIMFAAAASRHANTNLVAAVLGVISAIIPITFSIPLISKKSFENQKFGLFMAIIAGILIAFFVMAINKAYSENKVGIVAPVVFGGAIFLSTAMSYFIFREKISQLQLVGLIFLALGFIMISYARVTAK